MALPPVWFFTVHRAKPKNSENTTICSTELPAIASKTLFGKTLTMKSLKFSAVVFRLVAAPASGSDRLRP